MQRESIVVYAHYDVVFADPTEWSSDPFLLTVLQHTSPKPAKRTLSNKGLEAPSIAKRTPPKKRPDARNPIDEAPYPVNSIYTLATYSTPKATASSVR